MTQFANAMAVFKLLPRTNCKKCNETTCLAFASKVFLGQKEVDQCPFIGSDIIDKYQNQPHKETLVEKQQQTEIKKMKQKIAACDLKDAADRTGGVYADGRMTLRIMGKPFSIDHNGDLFSNIHINPWVVSNILRYVLTCKGVPLTQKWVSFRELEGGREQNGLFVQTSEVPFKKIADRYIDFFEDLILIFNGQRVEKLFDSDISLILSPLPKLPILICYWKPEEGMASDLHLFFDSSADQNANIDIAYGIAVGIVVMFEKISIIHGVG